MPYSQGNDALAGGEKLTLIVNKPSDDKTDTKDLSEDFIDIAFDVLRHLYIGFCDCRLGLGMMNVWMKS